MSHDYELKDRHRRVLRRNLTGAKDYFFDWAKKGGEENIARCEMLLAEVTAKKVEYEQLVIEMLGLLDADDEDFKENEDMLYKDAEEVNYGAISLTGKISAFLKSVGNRNPRESIAAFDSSSSYQSSTTNIRLPKIQIPKFDGNPRKFLKFKSLFTNLIHDDVTIPNVRKLYYLQEALEGSAEEFIRDVDITETSYTLAWTELSNRYENKRVIIRTHLNDLFELKKIKDESGIRMLLDSITSSLRGLKGCGENPDNWSTVLSYLVSSKVDDATKRDFENSIEDKRSYPQFKTLVEFLEVRASAVEERKGLNFRDKPRAPLPSTTPHPNKFQNRSEPQVRQSFAIGSSAQKCWACNHTHLLLECKVFLSKSPRDRYEIVRKNQLCANCFGKGHKTFECKRSLCKVCGQKHHTLLHFDRPKEVEKPKELEVVKTSSASIGLGCVVLLPTAVVQFSCQSKSGFTRILSDPASEVTMVTESFVRRYHLTTQKAPVITTIEGVGEDPVICSRMCKLSLKSRISDFELCIDCLVVPNGAIKYVVYTELIEGLRSQNLGLELAETNLPYNSTDIIVGAEFVEEFLLNETIKVDKITLRKSEFGWLALGNASSLESTSQYRPSICHTTTLRSIEHCLNRLFKDEEIEFELPLTEEQTNCVKHFEATYRRDSNGRFLIQYPLKGDPKVLSNTKRAAENSIDRILVKDTALINEYHKFIREYEKLEHLQFVKFSEIETELNYSPYYLPQLLVIRPDKSTTKVRVVFHASFKSKNGRSFNDILMTGPTLQLDLFDIILRFRRHKIAFTADIEKMYRQILVDHADRHLQKIIYKETVNSESRVGILNTLTYGTAPASFIATKCLFVLADSIAPSNPYCAEIIRKDFYMDDLLTGADTVDEAIKVNQAIQSILLSARFPLRKYISNNGEFLTSVDPELVERATQKTFESEYVKVLGLSWMPAPDNLGVTYRPNQGSNRITKRKMLSEISSIFDVLGVYSPVTIRSKLLMQRLWQEKIDWNDFVPESVEKEFRTYQAELTDIGSVTLKRHYTSFSSKATFDLVGFCDASNRAYCAVVYIRVPININEFAVSFVCAKTKVAPLKELTIPRLELQAAQLLAKLLVKVESILSKTEVVKYAFSDSTTVLCWLNKPPATWKSFVANRVQDIQSTIPTTQWAYVHTSENPADLATRGITIAGLKSNRIWLEGPKMLRGIIPSNKKLENDERAFIECKKQRVFASCILPAVNLDFIDNSSSFTYLVGSIGYVRRIITNNRPRHLELTANERADALNSIIRVVQLHYYPTECSSLQSSSEVHKRSSLLSLSPFIHSDGLVRVGGRLRNANLSFGYKHPIILPARCRLIELYVCYLHERHFHATKSFILNFINANYWIVGNLKSIIKKAIHRCVTCRRFRGETCEQIMGQLPACRINASDAFTNVGIDFAGPLDCKCTNHRTIKHTKIYMAVFVCMLSRAIHIEIVSNLTAASFIDSLKRFIGRRGLPKLVMSDNGRTFIGAKNYLDLTSRVLSEWAANEGITWKFIPPRSPNQGGLWEAAIKSAKSHLKRVLKGQVLSFEDYTTVFVQIEAILNSRPLNYRRDCDKSIVMITPAHLAIGRPLLFVEETPKIAHSLGARANAIRNAIDSFWGGWRKDYLSQLQAKSKWKSTGRNLIQGDVVLIKEDNQPPAIWPMAIVTHVYPDSEGAVRVVDVRFNGKEYRRSVGKLVLLLEA